MQVPSSSFTATRPPLVASPDSVEFITAFTEQFCSLLLPLVWLAIPAMYFLLEVMTACSCRSFTVAFCILARSAAPSAEYGCSAEPIVRLLMVYCFPSNVPVYLT